MMAALELVWQEDIGACSEILHFLWLPIDVDAEWFHLSRRVRCMIEGKKWEKSRVKL